MALRNFAIDITDSERREFKALAKSRGMTVQGLMGQLVKRELRESSAGDVTVAHDHAGDIGRAYEN